MPLSLTCQGMDELRNEKRAHSLLAIDRTSPTCFESSQFLGVRP